MKLLLDEMFPAAIAVALRSEGHDVVAAQEQPALRELSDRDLFASAQALERAVVTENVADFMALATESHAGPGAHWGLVLTTNRSFPRHHERFIGELVRALGELLEASPAATAASAIYWLRPARPTHG